MSQDSDLLKRARAVSRAHAKQLLAKANVVGVGVGQQEGNGELMLVVMVTQKLPRSRLREADLVPEQIEGFPVEVRVVGELRADALEIGPAGPPAKGGSDETD